MGILNFLLITALAVLFFNLFLAKTHGLESSSSLNAPHHLMVDIRSYLSSYLLLHKFEYDFQHSCKVENLNKHFLICIFEKKNPIMSLDGAQVYKIKI